MSRLPRPNPPLEVRCRVALRQLGEIWPDQVIAENHRKLGALLDELIVRLASLIAPGVDVVEFNLDHDPALENREQIIEDGKIVGYVPAANDPEYLIYREAMAHKIKTLVHGEHGQHSDAGIARKRKRIAKKNDPKRRIAKIAQPKNFKWPKRPFPKRRKR